MRYLPRLTDIRPKCEVIDKFAGLDLTAGIKDGEFAAMKNLSSAAYPAISPRAKRHFVRKLEKPNGLFMHDRLAWIDGTKFFYNGEYKGEVENSKKSMTAMGAYIAIFPDKLLFNTETLTFEPMENTVEVQGASYTLTDTDGLEYTYTSGQIAPDSPENGSYWLDTSGSVHVLKQYSSAQGSWATVETVCVKISSAGIGKGFYELDTVKISGMKNDALNGDFSLNKCSDDYIVITAITDTADSQTEKVTVERRVPDMDYITSHGNRLWGCSSDAHEIYASKQGDAKNWYSYLGIASDSYAATIGTKGDFTAAETHLGYVTFFKEDMFQRVYGSKPANYQLNDTCARGIEKGSQDSAAMINETLYYKSKNDICCLSTGLPQSISAKLGNALWKNAVGGALGRRYYISMQDENGNHGLFAYDTELGTWHKEDDTQVLFFAGSGHDLFFLDTEGRLYNMGPDTFYDDDGAEDEKEIEWFCETGSIGMNMPDCKYVSGLKIRLEAGERSVVSIALSYDEGEYRTVYSVMPGKKRSVSVPIVPRRCDTMRIKIYGKGDCRIFSITKSIEQGSGT